MFGHTAVAIATALYVVFMAAVLARWALERRAERALHWPTTLKQRQMEQYGMRFMLRHGWRVTLASSHGSYSLYACVKQDEYVFTLFLRDSSMFGRQLRSLRSESLPVQRRLVIVLFDRPNQTMRLAAEDAQVAILHYADLPTIGALHQALLARMMAPPARQILQVPVRQDATTTVTAVALGV